MPDAVDIRTGAPLAPERVETAAQTAASKADQNIKTACEEAAQRFATAVTARLLMAQWATLQNQSPLNALREARVEALRLIDHIDRTEELVLWRMRKEQR